MNDKTFQYGMTFFLGVVCGFMAFCALMATDAYIRSLAREEARQVQRDTINPITSP